MPMVGHPEIDQVHGTVRAYACTTHEVIGLEYTAGKALGSFEGECVALNFLITIAYLTISRQHLFEHLFISSPTHLLLYLPHWFIFPSVMHAKA